MPSLTPGKSPGSLFSIPDRLPVTNWPGRPGIQILRGDVIHPVVSGNKLFKLLPLIDKALQLGVETLVSVGGRYSNHLHALSWIANQVGLASVGLVRGFPEQALTPTLIDCQKWGMEIQFVRPTIYHNRHREDFWQSVLEEYPKTLRIDEGGWSSEAVHGSSRWWEFVPAATETLVCAVGSGTTLAGLLQAAPPGVRVVGVPAYRDPEGYQSLRASLSSMNIDTRAFEILVPENDKGFGKLSVQQREFRKSFTALTEVPTDPVYTTKVLCALDQLWCKSDHWPYGQTIVIHSGGLQGNRSLS